MKQERRVLCGQARPGRSRGALPRGGAGLRERRDAGILQVCGSDAELRLATFVLWGCAGVGAGGDDVTLGEWTSTRADRQEQRTDCANHDRMLAKQRQAKLEGNLGPIAAPKSDQKASGATFCFTESRGDTVAKHPAFSIQALRV